MSLEPSRVIEVPTALGDIRAAVHGDSGPVVVCSHPALTDSRFWDPVVAAMAGVPAVLVTPDMPLGAQRRPVPDRDALTLESLADALVAVGRAVTDGPLVLIGNDTGGAVAQIATARHPDVVRGLLLCPCEVFEHCPPRPFRPIRWLLGRPAGARLVARAFGIPQLLATPGPLNQLTRQGVDPQLVDSWLQPARDDREVAADLAQLIRSMQPASTLAAAEGLASWTGRAAVVWARRDPLFFPPRDGRRIAAHLGVDVTWAHDAAALLPLDAPEVVASALSDLLAEVRPRTP